MKILKAAAAIVLYFVVCACAHAMYYDEETGLHYNYFRDYDSQSGRYIQSDVRRANSCAVNYEAARHN